MLSPKQRVADTTLAEEEKEEETRTRTRTRTAIHASAPPIDRVRDRQVSGGTIQQYLFRHCQWQ